MQEVALYDPNRKPASWMEIIQPGEYAAFLSDIETGAEMTGDGHYFDDGMIRSCLLFDSLEEAEQYCQRKIEDSPNLRFDVFDSHGRANPPVATFANPRHRRRLDSPAESRRLMRWGWVAIVASLPFKNQTVEAPLYKIENIEHDSRIPNSGPGGRRFKSSLADQSFQAHKEHFWIFVYSDVVDFVDGRSHRVQYAGDHAVLLLRKLARLSQPRVNLTDGRSVDRPLRRAQN